MVRFSVVEYDHLFYSMPRKAKPFIRKTFDLLSEESLKSIVSWSPSNDSFIIYQVDIFEKEILPKYFKHNNLGSFVRQLNTYGFRKVTRKDVKEIEFKHKLFIKGEKELLQHIIRKTPKSVNSEEDNFENLKKKIEEIDNIRALRTDNETMAKAMITIKTQQLKTEQELCLVKKELELMKGFIRQMTFAAQYQPQFHQSHILPVGHVNFNTNSGMLNNMGTNCARETSIPCSDASYSDEFNPFSIENLSSDIPDSLFGDVLQ